MLRLHQQIPQTEDIEVTHLSSPRPSHNELDQTLELQILKNSKKHKKLRSSHCWQYVALLLILLILGVILYLQLSGCPTNVIEVTTKLPSDSKNEAEFIINRQVWMYQTQDQSYLKTLRFQNAKRFCTQSGFNLNVITEQNAPKWLSPESYRKLTNIMAILADRSIREKSNLKAHLSNMRRMITRLMILYERGGLTLHHLVTVTENFNWIRTIRNNTYINRGNPGAQPRVVGFYSPFYSSTPEKQNKITFAGMEQVEKYMVVLPTIQNYLIAAEAKSEFIQKLIEQIIDILSYPEQIFKDIATKKYQYIHIDEKDVYYQYFMHACHRVLKDKQDQLDRQTRGMAFRTFAIDYYGLNLLNCYYGPYKLHVNLRYVFPDKVIQSFARLTLEEFQANVGPMRYIEVSPIQSELNDFLTRLKEGTYPKHQKGIMRGSFIEKMYFPNSNESFIYQNPEKPFTNTSGKLWDLPKIIWFYWDAGLTDKSINVAAEIIIFVQNLKRTAQRSGFELREVNASNVLKYLAAETKQKIDYALANSKRLVFIQTRSDLYRLAFLYQYGGVYLDSSMIPFQNFDWVTNIARFPSQYIYNRFGEVPSVFLFWDQNFGGSYEWQISPTANTKTDWRFSIQNSFIAANKGNEFIKEWFDLHLELLMTPLDQILKMFEQYQVKQKWSDGQSYYLLSMDAAKLVLGRREKMIKSEQAIRAETLGENAVKRWQGATDYYKIWSANCLMGFFKLRAFTNYDNEDRRGLNHYLTRFSQEYAEGILGKFNFIIKIIGEDRPGISYFLLSHSGNLLDDSHSQSIFRKYLYDEKYTKFKVVNEMIVLDLD